MTTPSSWTRPSGTSLCPRNAESMSDIDRAAVVTGLEPIGNLLVCRARRLAALR